MQCMMCFTTQARPITAKIQPTIFIHLCTVIPPSYYCALLLMKILKQAESRDNTAMNDTTE